MTSVRAFLVLLTVNNDIFLFFFFLLCSLLIFSARWRSSYTAATNRVQLILSKSFCLELQNFSCDYITRTWQSLVLLLLFQSVAVYPSVELCDHKYTHSFMDTLSRSVFTVSIISACCKSYETPRKKPAMWPVLGRDAFSTRGLGCWKD